jgi:hypothetical protein
MLRYLPVAHTSQYVPVLSFAWFEDTLSVFEKSPKLTHLSYGRSNQFNSQHVSTAATPQLLGAGILVRRWLRRQTTQSTSRC